MCRRVPKRKVQELLAVFLGWLQTIHNCTDRIERPARLLRDCNHPKSESSPPLDFQVAGL